MIYEKPQLIDAGMGEGVYMASGACDCFEIQSINENPNAGPGRYWLNFEIQHLASHSHTVEQDWAGLCVEAVFNMDIQAAWTVAPGDVATVSGNTILLRLETVWPADGDKSYNFIQVNGEGVEGLHCESLTAVHM